VAYCLPAQILLLPHNANTGLSNPFNELNHLRFSALHGL
jgi:hypothetical protein